MCPLVIQALLCAAAAAATSHVVDDFNTTEGMFTLTSQVPPVSTTEVTETSDGVRLDYSSHHLEMYSGFPYAGRLLGQGNYPCAEASYLRLEYRILQAPARPGVARLVMAVGDASECGLDAPLPRICATAGVQGFADRETYASILDGVLDDSSGEWKTLKLGLCGDSDPNSPFKKRGLPHAARGPRRRDRGAHDDDGVGYDRTDSCTGVRRSGPHESCGRRGGGRAARANGLTHTYIGLFMTPPTTTAGDSDWRPSASGSPRARRACPSSCTAAPSPENERTAGGGCRNGFL